LRDVEFKGKRKLAARSQQKLSRIMNEQPSTCDGKCQSVNTLFRVFAHFSCSANDHYNPYLNDAPAR
ncbi:hypothetical protein P3705_26455, partial [Vibrio parahaemolyticus]|nr:hypothetical protein [Vibrio parahaemolyticus]MDF5436535.1 hypothetical protein [Vibrio parahaemolyticus]